MKVLWFSLSPCSSTKRFGAEKLIQGWMISLENAIKHTDDITLEVAYFSDRNEAPFEFEGVKYYPIQQRQVHCRQVQEHLRFTEKEGRRTDTCI